MTKTIHKQLQKKEFRFILLNGKIPFEKDWQNTNNYPYNHKKLLDHINKGGNYGVLCGKGNLLVIDFDNKKIQNELINKLPKGYSIKTGSGLIHRYFICKNGENLKVLDKDKNSIADIQYTSKQVVGSGSIHPETKKQYVIIDNSEIPEIDMAEIKALFSEWINPKKEKTTKEEDPILNKIKNKISMIDLLNKYGVDTSKNPTRCLWHSSKGGKCLSFNEDLFYCFHCDKGGDIFNFVMVEEKCDFLQARKKLAEMSGIELNETSNCKIKSVSSSGLIDDNTFFHTIFINEEGSYIPIVLTSEGKTIKIKDNYAELLKQGTKKEDISEEQKYHYFKRNEVVFKFQIEDLFFRDTYRINTVNDDVLNLIKGKKLSKDVYNKCTSKLKEYWDHYNEYEYDIQIVSIFDTYILRTINKTFYEILQGKEDTGKSTLQKFLSKLQFNGLFGGKGTVALNVRLIHFLGCNVNQDEFDKMSKEEKKIFIGVANSGLYGDGTYSIVDTNKRRLKDQITILNTFSKKTFSTNNLYQFDKSFLSRCYILITTRQGRKLKDIMDLSEREQEEFQNLRNEIFVFCLLNWKDIKNSIQEVKKELEEEGVFGRKTDMNSIILGIIKHFKGDYYKKVKTHLMEKEGLQQEERSNTKESLMFEFLSNKFLSQDSTIEVTNKEISEYLAQELNLNEEEQKGLGRSIGWIFRNYDLVRKKENIKRGSRGERKYIIGRSVFVDMLRRFQYDVLVKKFFSEPMLRNGKNGKNGRSVKGSEVSEVSEHRFQKDLIEETEPKVPVENIEQTPSDTILNYIRTNPLSSFWDIQEALKIEKDALWKDMMYLKGQGEIVEQKPDRWVVLE